MLCRNIYSLVFQKIYIYMCVFIHSTHHYVTCILLLRNLSHNQSLSNSFLSFLIFTPCVCIYLEFWVYTKKRLSLVVLGRRRRRLASDVSKCEEGDCKHIVHY